MVPDEPLSSRPIKHGTVYAYQRLRCHCDLCTAAWRDYHREGGYDKRYRDRMRTDPAWVERRRAQDRERYRAKKRAEREAAERRAS